MTEQPPPPPADPAGGASPPPEAGPSFQIGGATSPVPGPLATQVFMPGQQPAPPGPTMQFGAPPQRPPGAPPPPPPGPPGQYGAPPQGMAPYGVPPPGYPTPAAPFGVGPYAPPGMVQGRPATPGDRLLAVVVQPYLMYGTLVIGYLIWELIAWARGKTPTYVAFNFQVVHKATGQPASWGRMFLRFLAFVLNILLMGVLIGFVLLWMPFWDDDHQTFWDKLSGTVVLDMRGRF